jgi:hypothetical protein
MKKIDLYRDFPAGVYLSEAQNPASPPPPFHIVYCVHINIIPIHTGRGGELNQREG